MNNIKNILVTGGAGFIGTNFVKMLMNEENIAVTVLDILTYAGNINNLNEYIKKSNFSFIHGDIGDKELVSKILTGKNIDTVVHFAAESHVDRSISGPEQFITTNVLGTFNLLECVKEFWERNNSIGVHFHHVSTDEVYGSLGADEPAFTETNQYLPNSPYAASKASSDHLVRAYHHTYGLPVTTSNCSNNYGPYQFPEKLIPLCLLNILEGKNLPIYGTGDQIRDWLHVDDHNRGIFQILKNGVPGQVYNIGGNNEWCNLDTVQLLCTTVDDIFANNMELVKRYPESPVSKGGKSEDLISFVRDRPGHDVRYAIDASKISQTLGFEPKMGFVQGLRKTINWFLENESWWRSIKDGSYRN